MARPQSTAFPSPPRRLIRPAAVLLAAMAVAGPWALGGTGTGGAVACGVAAGCLLLALVERLHGALCDTEYEVCAAREEAAQHDAEWRDYCASQDARREETLRHLVEARLPAALTGEPVPEAQPAERHEGLARRHEELLATAVAAVRKVREREESLRLVVVALSRRVQASSHRIQEAMTALEAGHAGRPDVLAAGMRGDHAAAQQARIAQSLAVLCDEWPGQQWQKPHALVDVVRAGASRIVSYQRVKVVGDQDVAAAATVVEPLVHVVAELLANATQCAPPTTHVEVSVRPVTRGAVIEIDDAGLGMDEYALERAREIASGRRLLGFADLGEVPQTGLAVVGRYAERHDLKIDLLPSPYGGVRAVVLVPGTLLRTLEPAVVPAARRHGAGTAVADPGQGAATAAAESAEA
ncbi:MAG TPA: ATP-binding protein, partial [Streptomyces sp.]|nr:ATP-binding protein [Streptomyces sp.]